MNTEDCLQCLEKIPEKKRKDAVFCSKICHSRFVNKTKRPQGPQNGRSKTEEYKLNRHKIRYAKIKTERNKNTPLGKGKYALARSLGYRSMFEVKIANTLKENNIEFEYEPCYVHYVLSGKYVPDFQLPNGILIETKGRLTPADRRKMIAVRQQNPELDIRFVFQNARQRLSNKSKKSDTYGEWAERLGYQWAQGDIPEEWWDE